MVTPQTEFNTPLLIIRHKGLFSFPSLIKAARGWIKSEHYIFFEGKHKFEPDKQEVEMAGVRKMTEYVKYKIDVVIKTEDVRDVEVVQEGKKLKMQDGKVRIDLKGSMTLDWQGRFKGNKFLQYLQDFLHKNIIKKKIEQEWMDHLDKKIKELSKELHKNLAFEA